MAIVKGANYKSNPSLAKNLTREELISECNRLETLASVFSDRDYEISNEYQEQAKVLDMVLLDMMAEDDQSKAVV